MSIGPAGVLVVLLSVASCGGGGPIASASPRVPSAIAPCLSTKDCYESAPAPPSTSTICSDGQYLSFDHYVCVGEQCLTEICPGCRSTADCVYLPAPDYCLACDSGVGGCAHYECDAGQCRIHTCD
ncbi:MAG TPA: hypothetical protein VMK12_00410 [Anaeromyxobacteraceae bacterium]|nr:hypothetical protein [Anaeromyxobacteraceae bacterium]